MEVAGLVLGAIPIASQGLKSIKKGFTKLRKWHRYDMEIDSIVSRLETQQTRLQDVCDKLLCDLVPQSRIEDLIKDPLSFHSIPGLERKLRSRLWRSYHKFEATVAEIKAAVDQIREKVDNQERAASFETRRAIVSSFFDDRLVIIKDGISTMEYLIQTNVELETARKYRFHGRFLGLVRTAADGLYRADQSGLNCSCSHYACLKLQCRNFTMTPEDIVDDVLPQIEFRLAFSYTKPQSEPDMPTILEPKWMDVIVEPMAKRCRHPLLPSIPVSAHFGNTSLPVTINSLSGLFGLHTLTGDPSPQRRILDLCQKIRQSKIQTESYCYGFIADCKPSQTPRFCIHSAPSPSMREDTDRLIISLDEVLGKRRYMLLYQQTRLRLAMLAASNLLELYGTPCMPPQLSCKDIYMVQGGNDPICDNFFVLQTFPSPNKTIDQHDSKKTFGRNPTLFYLGILLIEIAFGKTLELLKNEEERSFARSGFVADYATAIRILEEPEHLTGTHMGSKFKSAVKRCIEGELHEKGVGLDDEDMSRDVWSGVVALLEEEVNGPI